MTDKSYVSMEQKVCPIFGKTFNTDALLLDKRLKASMEQYTVTGFDFCPEAVEKLDAGYVAFVAVDPDKSDKLPNGNISPEGAYRLGTIAWIRRPVAEKMINVPIDHPFIFADEEVIAHFTKYADQDGTA